MTARHRGPGEEAQLDAHAVIARARAEVPRLATESLDRIHGLRGRGLTEIASGRRPGDEVIAELARTLDHEA